MMTATNDIVRLNVGGTSFATTLSTLLSDSGSHLAKWLTTAGAREKVDVF
jgi:hypothetical protein